MTTYNTGNPIGSKDPRDLYDNAENLDQMINSSVLSYLDRLGVSRRTLYGVDQTASLVLGAIGYLPPVVYTAGLILNNTSQTVGYNGETYAPKSDALPFTTSGVFETNKFRLIQGVSSAELAMAAGSTLVGYQHPKNAVVTNVDDRLDDIYRLHQNINSVENKIVYCDPLGGSDSNPGTLSQPFKTFQRAVDECPRILVHTFTIDLVTAASLPVTYNEDVVIRDILSPTTNPDDPFKIIGLSILGAGPDHLSDDPKQCKIRSLTISGCTGVASPQLYGAHFFGAAPYYEQNEYVAIYGTQEAQLYNLSFEELSSAIAGVRVYGCANVIIKGADITNTANLVWAKRHSGAIAFNWYGTKWTGAGAGAVFVSEENSSVCIGYKSPSKELVGVTNNNLWNQNYGLVYDIGGIRLGRTSYIGNPELDTVVGQDSFGAGWLFNASATSAVAIGVRARADAVASVAIGADADAGVTSGTAVGNGALANEYRRASAFGAGTKALHEEATAIGYQATTTAVNSIMLGSPSNSFVYTYGNIEQLSPANIYMRSANNSRWRISVSDAGVLTVNAA